MNRRLGILLAIMVGLLLVWLAIPLRVTNSHSLMVELLEQVSEETSAVNPYLGNADLLRAEQQLKEADTVVDQIASLWEIAPIELRLGHNDAAITTLLKVQQLLPAIGGAAGPARIDELQSQLEYDLAIASLRKGETKNCVHCRTGESCILPIQGSGVHQNPEGSKQAIDHLNQFLEHSPENLSARWLLNLAHMTVGTYPQQVPQAFLIPPDKFRSSVPFPKFENIAADLGLDTFGLAGGSVVDDFDGDGFLDVVVSDWHTSASLHYFRNCGDGTFEDRSDAAGFQGITGGLNIRHADYDNDSDLDILVLRGGWMPLDIRHPNSLLQNDGQGVFRDVTFDVGLGDIDLSTQTADWADFDNDGWLDLFIGNEDAPNQLFRNTGVGTFVDVAHGAGVDDAAYAKGVVWGDVNDDFFPDIFVSNLGSPNRLYLNKRDGTFLDIATEAGVDKPIESFPAWFWDFNNDGAQDLFVAAYDVRNGIESFVADFLRLPHQSEVDKLYQGNGAGKFVSVGVEKKVDKVTIPMGSNFGDINGDGYLDYYLGTGSPEYEVLIPNRAMINRQGDYFDDVSMASGLGHLQKGHGISICDIDQDGDNDIFMVMGGAYPGDGFGNSLFLNPGFETHWLAMKLQGTTTNRSAIGARIHVRVSNSRGEQRSIYRWVNSGGSFGGNPLRQMIGLGDAQIVDSIEVRWPTSQSIDRFDHISVDQFIEITEGHSDYQSLPYPVVPRLIGNELSSSNASPE